MPYALRMCVLGVGAVDGSPHLFAEAVIVGQRLGIERPAFAPGPLGRSLRIDGQQGRQVRAVVTYDDGLRDERLDAESVRDNALKVAGLLSEEVGGPSAHPYQPRGYWAYLNFPPREWDDSQGAAQHRRGLYTHWQRTFLHPSLSAFDAPTREECVAERTRSNVPQQALVLLNDPTYVEAARAFAARIVREGGKTTPERLAWSYATALSRAPTPEETRVLSELQRKHGWPSVARAILNLPELITRP